MRDPERGRYHGQARRLAAVRAPHGLRIASITDLVRHRIHTERAVHRIAEAAIPTSFGEFRGIVFRSENDGLDHVALVKGTPGPTDPVLVRCIASA
jgi:3,4-dihydroxy 2-butanone 4-phosphate synthase/GTP cyclohydrolase II